MKLIWTKITEYIRHTDKYLWAASLAMSGIGCVLLWGILNSDHKYTLYISSRNLIVQMGAIGLGVMAALILSKLDYNMLKQTWMVHVPLSYGMVLLTFLIGVGAAERPEHKRWLVIPYLDVWIQPAELLKISFILAFAYHIIHVGEELNRFPNIARLGLHAAAPVLLIHLQGDDGTALLIATIAMAMLFMAGLSWKYIVAAAAACAAAMPLAWMYVLSNFQKQRILTLFNQEDADILGWYYQQHQAKIAMAVGGTTGAGLMSPDHVYVPEMHTDFIFTFLCESFGFIGALGVIALMAFLTLKLLFNSYLAPDQYGSLLCIGVFAMFQFQFIVNMGMCLSLFPVIGNPFPFLSYGGSSILTSFLGIGLAQSVYMFRKKGLFSNSKEK